MSLLLNTPVAGTEAPRAGDFISSEEAYGTRSRDNVTLDAVNDGVTKWVPGTVLGQKDIGSTATGATASTGFTIGTVTPSAGVLEGVYQGFFTSAGATGEFELTSPAGILVGSGKVGTAFAGGGLAFTLTDAGLHAAVGDTFTITVGSAVFANVAGGTGNPTCSAVTIAPGLTPGVYTFTYTDATHFAGVAPDATVLPAGVDGTAYASGGLGFTITAGGTASVAGDKFTITTHVGDGNYTAINFSGADGSQNAAGVLVYMADVSGSANVRATIISRSAEVKRDLLAWPSGATDDQARAAMVQLTALGIIVRGDAV